jgi:hypothetical protein
MAPFNTKDMLGVKKRAFTFMLNEFSFLVSWTFSYDFGAISQEMYLKKNWFIGIDYNFFKEWFDWKLLLVQFP